MKSSIKEDWMVDFLEELKKEEMWVSKEKRTHIPLVINEKYDELHKSVIEGNVYHAILCAKDVCETVMKIPAVMGLIIINAYIENDNDIQQKTVEEFKVEREAKRKKSEKEIKLKRVLEKMLKNPLAMGSWLELLGAIKKSQNVFGIPTELIDIIEITEKMLNKSVLNTDGKFENATNWRNSVIGHGALQCEGEGYWEQVKSLVSNIHDYFTDESAKEHRNIDGLYTNFKIEVDGVNINLISSDRKYDAKAFMRLLDNSVLYFDSYYSEKEVVSISDFTRNTIRDKNNEFYHDLYDIYISLLTEKEAKELGGIGTTAKDKMMNCLHCVTKYKKPEKLIYKLNETMDEMGKGVILLQMERGTGKSALARALDGRYLKTAIQKDLHAIVRTVHIRNLNLSAGSLDDASVRFYNYISNVVFAETGVEDIGRIHTLEGEKQIKLNEWDLNLKKGVNSKEAFAAILEIYRDAYDEEELEELEDVRDEFGYDQSRLVLIIDGIDELNQSTQKVLDSIPYGKFLADGIFVILTSRNEDEDNLSQYARDAIMRVKNQLAESDVVISEDRFGESYVQLLQSYIEDIKEELSVEEKNNIIKNAQNRFLYIHPYMTFGKDVIKDGDGTAKEVAKNYINKLLRMYYGASQDTLLLTVGLISLFNGITIEDMCRMIFGSELTFDVVGVVNDLLPLLTTKRDNGANLYEYSNTEYNEYVFETYLKELKMIAQLIYEYTEALPKMFEQKKIDKTDLRRIDEYFVTVSKRAENFDRINDGGNIEPEVEEQYGEIACCLMEATIAYLSFSIVNRFESNNVSLYLDFFNYISAYGRATKELKAKVESLKVIILDYCKKSGHISNWFDVFFLSGEIYRNDRKDIITSNGVDNELIDYLVALTKIKENPHGYDIHIYVHNLYTALECCSDENMRYRIHNELRILLEKEWKCPPYYEEKLKLIREENKKYHLVRGEEE